MSSFNLIKDVLISWWDVFVGKKILILTKGKKLNIYISIGILDLNVWWSNFLKYVTYISFEDSCGSFSNCVIKLFV